jgi:hypothetical protein
MKFIAFLLSIFLLTAFSPDAKAQLQTLTVSAADDSLVNTDVGYATKTITGKASSISFVVLLTRNSGTAAGTVILEGSHDGTSYATVPGTSTFTMTNVASQVATFSVAPSTYNYYRATVTTSGTVNLSPTGTVLIRR